MRQLPRERKRRTARRMAVSCPVAAFVGMPREHDFAGGVPGPLYDGPRTSTDRRRL